MAESCSDKETYKVLSPYQVLLSQIATELDSFDVKTIHVSLSELSILTEVSETDTSKSGLDLISKLQRYRYIAPNNLDLLLDLLTLTKHFKLKERVENFIAKTVIKLDDATIKQMDRELPAPMAVDLYLVLSGRKELLSQTQIDTLKQEICKCINLKGLTIGHLPYICSRENEGNQNTTMVRFQFPEHFRDQPISETLISSAVNKEAWLRENQIIMLKVDGQSSINIEENVEFKPRYPEPEYILAKKPRLQAHKKNVVDVILVVEMPTSVTPSNCKTMLTECQFAADYMDLSKDNSIDINLAAVKFGNHSSSDQPIAFIVQDFCKEFKVYPKLKKGEQCGGGGNSGMADALAKVVELSEGDKIRPEASKVCVMISFLSKSSKHLEHYRCNHGNDVIKLTNTLAQREIPLYILGVHGNTQSAEERLNVYFEECFLAGVCHIHGGRYFRVSKNEVMEVNKIISNVVVNDLSIENHSEITGEVVIDALNNHYGDINDRQLANDVAKDPRIKPLQFEKLLQNGRSLEPITQVARRVAFADDLTDAKEAMESIHERKTGHESKACRSAARSRDLAAELAQRGDSCVDVNMHSWEDKEKAHADVKFVGEFDIDMYCEDVNADVMKSSHESPETSTLGESKEIIDLEMASRIVKRHLHRMAYYKKKH